MTKLITRFAPSPTGNLHLGSARTALINYIVSKQSNSKFYLRIEDTDKVRSNDIFKQNIIEGLSWLGIKWDSEPQIQSKRINFHQQIGGQLLKNNYAYKCNCDEEKLESQRKNIIDNNIDTKKICTTCKNDTNIQNLESNYALRLKIPTNGSSSINDLVQGEVNIENKELDDFIILRKDNSPTYMLAVVVDDYDLGVNFIIRGNDHLTNSFRQKYIYKFMNWSEPKYAHIPLIHGEDGNKLSKRHGAINIIDLKKKGYLPESIINNLILLGWSPNKKNNELVSFNEIINQFKIDRISKSSSIFNFDKLNFFNNHYLRINSNLYKFVDYCKENKKLSKFYEEDSELLLRIFKIYNNKINFYEEILNYIDIYFDKYFVLAEINDKFDQIFKDNFEYFKLEISELKDWSTKNLENFILKFLNEKNIKFPVFAKPLRFLLTKSYVGPSLSDIFFILGKKNSIERLNNYIINK